MSACKRQTHIAKTEAAFSGCCCSASFTGYDILKKTFAVLVLVVAEFFEWAPFIKWQQRQPEDSAGAARVAAALR
jgi:hypothetical protein